MTTLEFMRWSNSQGRRGRPRAPKTPSPSLHCWRTLVGGFLLIRMDHAIFVGIERAMFGVHLLGRQCQFVTIFAGMKTHGVVPTIGLGHAAGKGAGVNQVRQGRGIPDILFLVLLLSPNEGMHVN